MSLILACVAIIKKPQMRIKKSRVIEMTPKEKSNEKLERDCQL